MTTSKQTDDLDHPAIRRVLGDANELPLPDRVTLLKGLIPAIAQEMASGDFVELIDELRLKGERFYDALSHPGEGRNARTVAGERDVEGR